MNREKFLHDLCEVLQIEENIDFETKLEDIEEWDSLAIMSTIAFLDKNFGIKTNYSDFTSVKTIEDILKKVNIND